MLCAGRSVPLSGLLEEGREKRCLKYEDERGLGIGFLSIKMDGFYLEHKMYTIYLMYILVSNRDRTFRLKKAARYDSLFCSKLEHIGSEAQCT